MRRWSTSSGSGFIAAAAGWACPAPGAGPPCVAAGSPRRRAADTPAPGPTAPVHWLPAGEQASSLACRATLIDYYHSHPSLSLCLADEWLLRIARARLVYNACSVVFWAHIPAWGHLVRPGYVKWPSYNTGRQQQQHEETQERLCVRPARFPPSFFFLAMDDAV